MKKSYALSFMVMLFCFAISAQAHINNFLGNWKNVDPNTRGVTRIQIKKTRGHGTIKVRAWGKCHPQDCDWGEVVGHIYAPNVGANLPTSAITATAIFKSRGIINLVVMRPGGRKTLAIEVFTRFTDNSRRSHYTARYRLARYQFQPRKCPDLVVTQIHHPPIWDHQRRRMIIKATIKNIGNAPAGRSIARLIDPSTSQLTGAPYNNTAAVPPLGPGQSHTATFYLPYNVFNPDATLEVTADYKQMIKECKEDNNTKRYHVVG